MAVGTSASIFRWTRGYRAHVRLYLTPYLGRIPLAGLTAGQVQAMSTAPSRELGSAVI